MDAVLLARIQFGITAGFHFLFPPITLGLSFIILILETLYLKKESHLYKRLSDFLIRILGVVFVMGVATGIVLEFAFGNNWSEYSRMVGDIFGAPLAAEGVFSFFLESVFLGILVFGRRRVSQRAYWWSAFLVFFASHLSALWIIIANSWMQTPAGYRLESGRALLTDFFAAALNHSTVIRYVHTVVAGWMTGSLLAAAVAAWFLLKTRHRDGARLLLKVALWMFIVTSLLQLGFGHLHSVQVAETQPEKMAAFESLWQTESGAPFTVLGIPDASARETRLALRVPKLLSFLIHFDPNAEVLGLDAFPADERPPVFLPFMSYHIMILLGLFFILMSVLGLLLIFAGRLWSSRWYQRLLIFTFPLPLLTNEFGWIAAEVGRQPWAVYKVLRTADAASKVVPVGNILFSLIMFVAVYSLIAVVGVSVIVKLVRKGPEEPAAGESNPQGGR
jgi:cytochrome d ubiquinol oxidase subunit I